MHFGGNSIRCSSLDPLIPLSSVSCFCFEGFKAAYFQNVSMEFTLGRYMCMLYLSDSESGHVLQTPILVVKIVFW